MGDQIAREARTIRKHIARIGVFMADETAEQAKATQIPASTDNEEAAKETKTIQTYIAGIVASVIPMLMLLWIMHTGFKLATEPRQDPRYHHLAILFGVVSIVFGLVYFFHGIAIVASIVLKLMAWLQRRKKSGFNGGHDTDATYIYMGRPF